MASIMNFTASESAKAFTNQRIHAGHRKLHDPINDHMNTHRSACVVCDFSCSLIVVVFAVVCHLTVIIIIDC
jgi:hypothetical protein